MRPGSLQNAIAESLGLEAGMVQVGLHDNQPALGDVLVPVLVH